MSKYIVIPNIKICNANAQPVWWIVGAPPPTAFVGFAQALALKINPKGHDGVAVVHHDIQFLGEQLSNQYGEMDFLPHQYRASGLIDKTDYAKGSRMSLSGQPTARCHLTISLVIAMADDAKISSQPIASFLRGARIAGGSIIKHGNINCGLTTHKDALMEIKKNAQQIGYSIIERQDLMIMQEGDRDMLDVLLRNTRRYKSDTQNPEHKSDEEQLKSFGWVVPTCLGYAGISALKERNKARNDLPHLYVEPLVGLIQYQSAKDAALHFWHYTNPQPNVFVLSTNKEL